MRRIFCAFLFGLMSVSVNVFAGEELLYQQDGGDCMVFVSHGSYADYYRFCGTKKSSCMGKTPGDRSDVRVVGWNDFTDDIRPDGSHTHFRFGCCKNNETGAQTLLLTQAVGQEAPLFVSKGTRKKELEGGGTCTQVLNECGNVAQDCDTPDDCPEGYRPNTELKRCVEICKTGWGYKSEDSGECEECNFGKNQGVNGKGVCKHCNPGSEFWSPSKRECISRDSFSIYSSDKMNDCWKCPANDFDNCVTTDNIDGLDSGVRERCRL